MTVLEKTYRFIWHFFMALSSTALLPAIYFIKIGCKVWHFRSDTLSLIFDIILYLGIPLIMSLISLFWMKNQSDDSINNGVNEIAPVNHEYLPIYLGYIFVSLSLPSTYNGGVDWTTLITIYLLICLFVTLSRTLCFNPLFIILGYGYYQVTTKNGVKVFVITRKRIRKGDQSPAFTNLHKVSELVFFDSDNINFCS